MSNAPPKRRETATITRLRLECRCGIAKTLWVDPDAPVRMVAKAHGWKFLVGDWMCPECVERYCLEG